METTLEVEARSGLAEGLVRLLESAEGADEVFAPACFFDLNVPGWRFQVQEPRRFVEWWHQEVDGKGRVGRTRRADTPTGFVLETDIDFAHHGHDLYARQIFVCEVAGGRIAELVLYCTGDWDPETRARHATEAPMIRP